MLNPKDFENAIEEIRTRRKRNSFLQIISLIGVLALTAAIVVSVIQRDRLSVVIEEAQESLKITCQEVELAALPREERENCEAAEQNRLPEKLGAEVDDPENQDAENQDPENQDPEIQDSETQEPETQDPDAPDSDVNDPDPTDDQDPNDPDPDDPEIQDEEIQDPEIQDPEEQNSPVCPPGFSQEQFVWSGEDGLPNTGDERTWLLCMEDM